MKAQFLLFSLKQGRFARTSLHFLLGDNQLEVISGMAQALRLILVLTYLLASFLTSAYPFPLEPPRLNCTGNVLF